MLEGQPPDAWRLITLLFLLIFSMFFSSGETAFVSCNILRIKYLAKRNKKARCVLEIIKEKNKFLVTSLIGNSIVNILIGMLITSITLQYSTNHFASVIAATIATILVLLFGEIVPKSVALSFPETIALKYSLFTQILIRFFLPLSTVFLHLTSFFLKMFEIKVKVNATLISEDDLKNFFENSHKQGNLTKCEKEMMNRILSYDDRRAKDVMCPRTKIVALNINATIEEALALSEATSYSRFPVFKEDIDDIQGILCIQEFLFSKECRIYLQDEKRESDYTTLSIKLFLKPPIFVFENAHLYQIRKKLKDSDEKMAIVIDEYGGTLGLVTIEDLNEEIFGEIVDEYDKEVGMKNFYTKLKDGILLKGEAPLSMINEEFGLNLVSKNSISIAGWLLEQLQEMPNKEEGMREQFAEYEDIVFVAHSMDENRIVDVLMKEKK